MSVMMMMMWRWTVTRTAAAAAAALSRNVIRVDRRRGSVVLWIFRRACSAERLGGEEYAMRQLGTRRRVVANASSTALALARLEISEPLPAVSTHGPIISGHNGCRGQDIRVLCVRRLGWTPSSSSLTATTKQQHEQFSSHKMHFNSDWMPYFRWRVITLKSEENRDI